MWCATDGVLVCSLFVVLCCALLCSGAAPACRCAVPVGSPVLPALARLPLTSGFRCLFAVQAGRACSSCSSISHHSQPKHRQPVSALLGDRNGYTHMLACFLGYTERVSNLFEVGSVSELPAIVASRYGVPPQLSCLLSPLQHLCSVLLHPQSLLSVMRCQSGAPQPVALLPLLKKRCRCP